MILETSQPMSDPSVAAKHEPAAGAPCVKPLKGNEGFSPPYEVSYGEPKPAPDPPLIIGFDAEWVEAKAEQFDDTDGADPTEPDAVPHNRVLSYQYAGRLSGLSWSGIIFPENDPRAVATAKGPRLTFADLLGAAIQAGIKQGHLRKWPKHVIAAAHWTRADLSAMADFAEIKRGFNGVKNTYATLRGRYEAHVVVGKRTRKFSVTLIDTKLLVPGTVQKLEALGELYQFEKLDPGSVVNETGCEVPAISRMDLLRQANPKLFRDYAIRDAEICALHVTRMIQFVRDDLHLDISKLPVTLGGLTVEYLKKVLTDNSINLADLNGYEELRRTRFNSNAGKGRLTFTKKEHKWGYRNWETLAELSFLGGRNETFWYGPSSDMDPRAWEPVVSRYDVQARRSVLEPIMFRDFDLQAAYATALASIGIPDYDRARHAVDPTDFRVDQLGFAKIKFRFPAETRFPCIPVKDTMDEHGLIYPLSGEAFVTGPELVLALHMGAEIEIVTGAMIPWIENTPRPFATIIKELTRRRGDFPKGSLQNELFKQMANSIYGKLGQGINEKSYFNTKTDSREKGRPCDITNPFLAGYVTGLIRALVSEMIASIHPRFTVLECHYRRISNQRPVVRDQHEGAGRIEYDGCADGIDGNTRSERDKRQLAREEARGAPTLGVAHSWGGDVEAGRKPE